MREEATEACEGRVASPKTDLLKCEEEVQKHLEVVSTHEVNIKTREPELASSPSEQELERERLLVKERELVAALATLDE